MAITRTRSIANIEISVAGNTDPEIMVVYTDTFDDSTDDQLPATTNTHVHLSRYTVTYADDGTETSTATDVTGEDQLVQDVCAAVWTD